MSALTEIAKRLAMKAAARAPEIPVATSKGQVVPYRGSPLEAVAAARARAAEVPVVKATTTTKAEPALESPGRRKFLKQAASSALRASVPDRIARPLEEGMARAAAEAGLRLPLPSADPSLVGKGLSDFILSGNIGDELYDIGSIASYPKLTQHVLTHFYPQDQLPYLESAIKKLNLLDDQIRALPKADERFIGDLPEWLHFGELTGALEKGQVPASMVPYEKPFDIPLLKQHNLTPEEFNAVKLFEKVSPHYTEGLDDVIEHAEAPTTSLEDFQKWIDQHQGYSDE